MNINMDIAVINKGYNFCEAAFCLFFPSSDKKAKLYVPTRLYINKLLCYLMLEIILRHK